MTSTILPNPTMARSDEEGWDHVDWSELTYSSLTPSLKEVAAACVQEYDAAQLIQSAARRMLARRCREAGAVVQDPPPLAAPRSTPAVGPTVMLSMSCLLLAVLVQSLRSPHAVIAVPKPPLLLQPPPDSWMALVEVPSFAPMNMLEPPKDGSPRPLWWWLLTALVAVYYVWGTQESGKPLLMKGTHATDSNDAPCGVSSVKSIPRKRRAVKMAPKEVGMELLVHLREQHPTKLSWNEFQKAVAERGLSQTTISNLYHIHKEMMAHKLLVHLREQHPSKLSWNEFQKAVAKQGLSKTTISNLYHIHKEMMAHKLLVHLREQYPTKLSWNAFQKAVAKRGLSRATIRNLYHIHILSY
ncbi:hypothetical protein AB1Y20_007931 [Prymnesium parvum]|uniref:Uncharacterized protein n=1 Tax=Prymnesium parvum TaxID=97485 RepID=A0AB34IT81_PRYPA